MLSKSLIQFSVDGWGCVPSLLFELRPNYGGGNEDNRITLVTQTIKYLSAMQKIQVLPLGWEDPQEKEMAIHSSILAWRSNGRRSLVVIAHGVAKSQTRLSDFTFEHSLALPLFGIGMKTDLFQSCGHC